MAVTAQKTSEIRARSADLNLTDSSKVFNTEIIGALEMVNMVELAEVLAVSALSRKESRGAHTCRDFPKRDDQSFLYHTVAYRTDDGPRLEKKDVNLGHWEPQERKY